MVISDLISVAVDVVVVAGKLASAVVAAAAGSSWCDFGRNRTKNSRLMNKTIYF